VKRRISAEAAWAICVPLNLAMALLAYLPLLVVYVIGFAVAGDLGWVTREPSLLSEGYAPLIGQFMLAWGLFLPIMIGLNGLVVRRTVGLTKAYWLVSALVVLIPNAIVIYLNNP
jgi:hypothetical protein